LWDRELVIPPAVPIESARLAEDVCTVSIACPQLCRRYTARVVRGVRIRPSPDWLAQRLRTLGIAVINNIVDITNYVMMECNQPLHAFDLAKINGGRIVVRDARPGENFLAIDHRTYQLQGGM
jgi:phenylalanyl-tRNA synthetase beta chain